MSLTFGTCHHVTNFARGAWKFSSVSPVCTRRSTSGCQGAEKNWILDPTGSPLFWGSKTGTTSWNHPWRILGLWSEPTRSWNHHVSRRRSTGRSRHYNTVKTQRIKSRHYDKRLEEKLTLGFIQDSFNLLQTK